MQAASAHITGVVMLVWSVSLQKQSSKSNDKRGPKCNMIFITMYFSSLQTHKKLHPRKSLLLFHPHVITRYPFLSRIHTTILHPTQNNSKGFQWSEQHMALFRSWVSSVMALFSSTHYTHSYLRPDPKQRHTFQSYLILWLSCGSSPPICSHLLYTISFHSQGELVSSVRQHDNPELQ